MWVIGGETGTDVFVNDVWSSSDGVNWTQATSSANFTARGGHSVVPFNGELWLIAGGDIGHTDGAASGTLTDEIWRSSNGVSWTPVSAGSRFAARYLHESIVHNNRMWVIAGSSNGNTTNEVWSTLDGINWIQATASASFSRRTSFAAVTHNNEMWVIGGYASDRFNDVWRSTDGVNWRVAIRGAIRMP